jgi:carbonic anhydrase
MSCSVFQTRASAFCHLTLTLLLGLSGCAPESPELRADTHTTTAAAPTKAHPTDQQHGLWSYEPATGPDLWAGLSPDYSLCAEGREQSPINLTTSLIEATAALKTNYRTARLSINHQQHVNDVIDNGHTIQIDYPGGSGINIEGDEYGLAQYHFHAPSEHSIEGRQFPMEMHLVHQHASGRLAVVGVMIESGAHNPAFDPIWENLPGTPGEQVHLEDIKLDVDDLLPPDYSHYRYLGSLTTPPCSENVKWFVLTQPITLSAAQIATFTAIFDHNNRPRQAIGDRDIVLLRDTRGRAGTTN